jgi:hypothetical protein
MHAIVIGQQYDPSMPEWPEGCHYNFDESGHWLHLMWSHPIELEISSVQSGRAQFGLYIQDTCIFILHQFGETPWNDAAYSIHLVAPDRRQLPEIDPRLHALLKIILIDSATGVVKAIRALTFSAEFTFRLHKAIAWQGEQPWDAAKHDEIIKSVYSNYQTTDLVQRAEIVCKGGE